MANDNMSTAASGARGRRGDGGTGDGEAAGYRQQSRAEEEVGRGADLRGGRPQLTFHSREMWTTRTDRDRPRLVISPPSAARAAVSSSSSAVAVVATAPQLPQSSSLLMGRAIENNTRKTAVGTSRRPLTGMDVSRGTGPRHPPARPGSKSDQRSAKAVCVPGDLCRRHNEHRPLNDSHEPAARSPLPAGSISTPLNLSDPRCPSPHTPFKMDTDTSLFHYNPSDSKPPDTDVRYAKCSSSHRDSYGYYWSLLLLLFACYKIGPSCLPLSTRVYSHKKRKCGDYPRVPALGGVVTLAGLGGPVCALVVLMFTLTPCTAALRPDGSAHNAAPTAPRDGNSTESFDSTVYLMKFGYLPMSDMETGALRTEEEMEKALKSFQRMAHLPPTGRFDALTVTKMQAPRCGVIDRLEPPRGPRRHARHHHHTRHHARRARHRRYVLGPSKWEKKQLTFRLLNYTSKLGYNLVHEALVRAFHVWMRVTDLTFHEVVHGDADIRIRFVRYYHHDGYPFEGRGRTLAHAFFPGDDMGGDIHFDDDEDWVSNSHEGTDLFTVAAHEIGHALGLGHSSVEGSLMFPWYAGYNENFSLHTDDIAGIHYLYGFKQTPQRPQTPPTRPPSTAVPPTLPTIIPTTTTAAPPTTVSLHEAPNACTTDIDAVAMIRHEAFFFKGRWFWRLDETGVMEGYPVSIERFWYGLPESLPGIDAAYEGQDGKIIFFKDQQYWIFNGNSVIPGFPENGKPITNLGFPSDIKKVDAAMVWGHNRKTYFFSGEMYWRYNEKEGRMDMDYPRDISMWSGVPRSLDGVFNYLDGKTYFIKGQDYWEFNNARMMVRDGYPKYMGADWLECPPRTEVTASTASTFRSQHFSGDVPVCLLLYVCVHFLQSWWPVVTSSFIS